MWTRIQLKEKAKSAFKKNYWKTVLVAFMVSAFVMGGSSGVSRAAGQAGNSQEEDSGIYDDYTAGRDFVNGFNDGVHGNPESDYYGSNDDNKYNDDDDKDIDSEFSLQLSAPFGAAVVFVIVFFIVFFVILLLVFVLDIFLMNPLEVGCRRFYYRNLNEQAEIKELAYAFDHNYKNVVKTMFLRGVYTFLWTLLFIIPGIVKGYEYRMIPYILAEHPDMPGEQAFAISRQMMSGNKWKAFVLDLSFLPWKLLSALTANIVGIFYVVPYVDMTNASLYEMLKYKDGRPYDMYIKNGIDNMGGIHI